MIEGLLIGLLLGGAIAYLAMRGKVQALNSSQATTVQLRQEISNSFKAMAADALNENSKQFSEKTDLQLAPLKEQLTKLEKETRSLEDRRQKSRGELNKQLTELQNATTELRIKSESITTALRGSSQARGQWGETVLERIFELAGMTRDIHYTAQKTTTDGQRPDFQIMLPGGDVIPVDSKVPMTAYLDAQRAETREQQQLYMKQHTQDLMKHVKDLARKDYSSNVKGEIDFTVMFLPGDHLLSATFEHDQHLQEKAMRERVLIATPVTIMALLRTVDLYWQQEKVAANAVEIAETAKEYHQRMQAFVAHCVKIGKGLKSSTDAYNKAIGSYNKSVLPQGRRVESLAVSKTSKQLEELNPLELTVRDDLEQS